MSTDNPKPADEKPMHPDEIALLIAQGRLPDPNAPAEKPAPKKEK